MLKVVRRRPYNEAQATEYALRLLAARMYAARELREKLEKVSDSSIAAKVVEKLLDWGYLNDAEFAEMFVRSRSGRWGRGRLRYELARRGVAAELIEIAMQESAADEESRALALLRKYAWRHKGDKGKMVRFLQGRGFALSDAIAAAESLIKLQREDDSG